MTVGLLGRAAPAAAFCQEVTSSPPANYDPVNDGCWGAGQTTLFWRNQCTSYSLQRDASGQVALADAQRVAADAFNAWMTAQCPGGGSPSIVVDAFAPVSCSQTPSQEHNNAIIFRDHGWPHTDTSNALGYTTLTVNTYTGDILGATIEINSTDHMIVAAAPAPQGAYDLPSILTHEAGHFLGLAHSQDSSAVMYAYYKPGSSTLMPDDVNAICSIYSPADGSRKTSAGSIAATSCNPSPPGGFLDQCGSLDAGVTSVGSGAVLDFGSDGGAMPCPAQLSCAVGRASGCGAGGFAACGLLVFGVRARRAARRARRRAERTRCGARRPERRAGASPGAVAGAIAAAVGASLLGGRAAHAGVSIAVLFDELLHRASAAAVVTPVEQTGVWEDGRIVTYTRVRVDRLVAGKLSGDPWLRTVGGAVGEIGQIVEGEASFVVGRASLVFVRPHVDPTSGASTGTLAVVEGAQGQFPVLTGDGRPPHLALARNLGAIVASRAPSPAPPRAPARAALDVLRDLSLDDAVQVVAVAWPRTHR